MSTALAWQPGPARPKRRPCAARRYRKPRHVTTNPKPSGSPFVYMVRPIVRSLLRELGLDATPANEAVVRRHIDKARRRRAGR